MNKVFINGINERSVHCKTSSKTGAEFCNVSVPCEQSVTGFASITVSARQVINATNFRTREIIPGRKTIILGDSDKSRTVQICTKAKTATTVAEYETLTMTNAEILNMYKSAIDAYNKSDEKPAETAVVAETATETAVVETVKRGRGRPKGSKNKPKN